MTPDRSSSPVSTGRLPATEEVAAMLERAFERFRLEDGGAVADYIPALARADRTLFGACIVSTDGTFLDVGAAEVEFSIQSISKPFVFALVCDAIGHESARQRLGVNATGLPFDSVMAIELNKHRTVNPMVNAG